MEFVMHKFTITGLLTLSLFFLSSSAMAGNAVDCEVLKNPGHSLYEPSLYGLCVAWHNADENSRVAIGDKFLKRATFPVPGSKTVDTRTVEQDFYCPCWDDVTFDDICALGEPMALSDENLVAFTDSVTFESFMSDTGITYCGHFIYKYGSQLPELDIQMSNLSLEESADCQAELEAILYDHAAMCSP